MNIDSIVFSTTYKMPLRHPVTDEPLLMSDGEPMWIEIASDESPQFKTLQTQYRNAALRNPQKKMTAEKEEARMTELLVAVTMNWRIEDNDGEVEFSTANARDLYQSKAWVRNQVTIAVFEDANFLAGELKAA
jgi:hypothetical protein